MIIRRWQEEEIKEALETMRVVMLVGARQTGKTTLAKYIVSDDCVYRTLDDLSALEAAKSDPMNFVKHNKKTMIIDEIQRVPELILAIKKVVDENPGDYGKYLITGSANIMALPTVKESLAGRVAKIRLRPFTYGEIISNPPKFLQRLKNRDFIDNNGSDKKKTLELAFKGGFPEAINKSKPKRWYMDYIEALVESDLRDIANIRRQDVLKRLIEVMSMYSSKFMDKKDIAGKLEINVQTLDEYLNILEKMYIIDKTYTWTKTDYQRIGKQSHIFLNDTGLMSSILNWNFENINLDADKTGKIIETYVYNQLVAQVDLDYYTSLYHYRDWEKHEIDFIIETENEVFGIDAKAGASTGRNDFKNLKWFSDKVPKDKKFTGVILYTGEQVLAFGDNMYLVPINNLWE